MSLTSLTSPLVKSKVFYSITSQKLSGRLMLFISLASLNSGAMSSGSKPAMPQTMGVTRNCFSGCWLLCSHIVCDIVLIVCKYIVFWGGKYVFFISDWEWDKFLSHKKKRLRIRNKQNVVSCCDLHNHPKNSFGCKGTIFNRG